MLPQSRRQCDREHAVAWRVTARAHQSVCRSAPPIVSKDAPRGQQTAMTVQLPEPGWRVVWTWKSCAHGVASRADVCRAMTLDTRHFPASLTLAASRRSRCLSALDVATFLSRHNKIIPSTMPLR
jgi:hypothetical protein